jgi:hypothetical protein
MRGAVELSDIHYVAFIFQNGGFIVIDVKVIGCRKDGHDRRKARCSRLSIHSIAIVMVRMHLQFNIDISYSPCILRFMCSDD